jgi:hypothetical protein
MITVQIQVVVIVIVVAAAQTDPMLLRLTNHESQITDHERSFGLK